MRDATGLAAGLALVATMVWAVEDTSGAARERLMEGMGGHAATLGRMAQGRIPFDAAAAAAARERLIAASGDIAATFAPGPSDDPRSKALPSIWDNYDDFTAKAAALHTVATGLDVSSVEAIQAGMGSIGQSCTACPSAYRTN